MTNFLDKLQQAWQAQCNKQIDVDPDQLLKAARLERRTYFWFDIGLSLFFLSFAAYFSIHAFRKNIHENWPWLISATGGAWVAGYVLIDRWLVGREAAHYDDSVLAHVKRSIRDIEHRMWLDRYAHWWYILPIALGCMIPQIFFFAMQYGKTSLAGALTGLLTMEFFFAVTMIFVHKTMRYAQRMGEEKRQEQLAALRALRDTLLIDESGD